MIRVSSTGGIPLFYQSNNDGMLPRQTGAIQWNGNNRCLEVSTGSGWMSLDPNISLDTTPEITKLIQWAKAKMQEEQELKALAEKDPTVRDLLNTIDTAKEQIKMVRILQESHG